MRTGVIDVALHCRLEVVERWEGAGSPGARPDVSESADRSRQLRVSGLERLSESRTLSFRPGTKSRFDSQARGYRAALLLLREVCDS